MAIHPFLQAIVDGPVTDVPRQAIRYRAISLTPIVVEGLPRAAGTATVKKYFEKNNVVQKWAESTWAKKKQAQKVKSEMTDFDRFNVMLLKKQRRRIVSSQAKKIKA